MPTTRARPVSVKRAAQKAKTQDNRARDQAGGTRAATADSFQNFAFKMGIGADNALTTSSYGFNPITRNRVLLDWIHRGSWLGGVAVDLVADDMTRAGVEIKGETDPQVVTELEEAMTTLGVWNSINETIKWSRLYGGAIAVMMIDGQDPSTPLRIETVAKGAFKGLLVLDRWMLEPSMENLVKDFGPDLGKPKYYRVTADAMALQNTKIHYSRCLRLEGTQLPYWQKLTENLWGLSVLERLYDRMVAFDSASTGAAQLVYKSYLRTMKVKGLRQVVAQGGVFLDGLIAQMDIMRRYQGQEGVTLIDSEDEYDEGGASASFGGLAEALQQFGQQLSGALQIPLTRLFGQSPGGFSSDDQSGMRTYYDGINQQQVKNLLVPLTRMYRVCAKSLGKKLSDGFAVKFKTLWQTDDKEKADIAKTVTDTVIQAHEAGLVSQKVAMEELKQSSTVTNVWSNIPQEDIDAAEDELPPTAEEAMTPVPGQSGGDGKTPTDSEDLPGTVKAPPAKPPLERPATGSGRSSQPVASKDSIAAVSALSRFAGIDAVIENPKGSIRQGHNWETVMPADYGYLRMTNGADGDQVDCYLGPEIMSADRAYIVDQRRLDNGAFDEHKVLLGFGSKEAALECYNDGFSDGKGPLRIGSVSEMTLAQFKAWLKVHDMKRPCSGWFGKATP